VGRSRVWSPGSTGLEAGGIEHPASSIQHRASGGWAGKMEDLMGCPVVHWELWSEDPDTAAEFYSNLLFEDPDGRVLGMWKQNPQQADG